MKRNALVPLLVVCIAVVFVTFFLPDSRLAHRPELPEQADEAAPPQREPGADAKSDWSPISRDPERRIALGFQLLEEGGSDEAALPGGLFGLVQAKETGLPLPGVTIVLFPRDPQSKEILLNGQTDAKGFFRIDANRSGDYLVAFRCEGRGPLVERVRLSAERATRLDASLELGAVLTVRVKEEGPWGRRPMEGALVTAFRWDRRRMPSRFLLNAVAHYGREARSDSAGEAKISGLTPGPNFLTIHADGFPPVSRMIEIPEETPFEAVLSPGGTIEGTVTWAGAGSRGDAWVFLSPRERVGRLLELLYAEDGVPVGKDGRFVLNFVPAGLHYVAAVDAKGLAALSKGLVTVLPGQTARVDLVFPVGGTIRGVVREPSGKPVGGAGVRLSGRDLRSKGGEGEYFAYWKVPAASEAVTRKTFCAADGTFWIEGVRPGALTLKVQEEGHSDFEQELTLEPSELVEIQAVIEPLEGSITGHIVDLRGSWVPGCAVGARPEGLFRSGSYSAVIDESGQFRIRVPNRGEFTVYGFGPEESDLEAVPPSFEDVRPGTEGLTFYLRSRASLRGRVIDQNGKAVPSFEVFVQEDSGGGYRHAASFQDAEGRFVLPFDVSRGRSFLFVSASFAPTTILSPQLRFGSEIEVVLKSGRTLRGLVVGPAGGPLQDCLVSLATFGSRLSLPGSSSLPFAVTGEDGRFLLTGIPEGFEGRIAVCPNRLEHPPIVFHALGPTSSNDSDFVIRIPEASLVELRLQAPGGKMPAGRFLVLDEDRWPLDPRLERSIAGRLRGAGARFQEAADEAVWLSLAAGSYELVYRSPHEGSRPQRFHFAVKPGETQRFEFEVGE